MDKKLLDKLKKAKGNWGKAKERANQQQGDFPEFEDGRYLTRFIGAEIGEAKSSGRLQLTKSFKFLDEPYKGQVKKAFDGLETEDNLTFVARDISRFGYEVPEDLADLEELFKAIAAEKPMVRIRLKTNGDFQNVYIDKVYDKDDEEEAIAEAGDEAGEEGEAEEESGEEEAGEEEGAEEEGAEEESGEEEGAEEESGEEDAQELTVGTQVQTTIKGAVVRGEVIEILDKEDMVRLKATDGKIYRAKIENLEAPEDEEPEVPAAPAKKTPPAKAAPPAKKTVAKKK